MKEVAVTTAYTGGKMDDDANAYERISTVDEDEAHLERFWEECRADICQELIGLVTFEGMVADESQAGGSISRIGTVAGRYELRLEVSRSFDEALLPSMMLSLFSYFVQGIAANGMCIPTRKRPGSMPAKQACFLKTSTARPCIKRSR